MKIFKSALVLTLVGVVCGLLIGTVNMVTAPVIEENIRKEARKAYEGFYPEMDDLETLEVLDATYVYEYVRILKDNEVIGHAFRAKGNNQRGLIDLVIAAELDGKLISVKILTTENTPGYYDKYEDKDKNLVGIDGEYLGSLEGIDNIGDATQTGDTLNAILKEVALVAPEYMSDAVVLNDYEKLFGIGAVATNDALFVPTDKINKKEIVRNSEGAALGFAYTGKVNTTVIPGKESADLELLVGVKLDGSVAGVIILESQHTEDRFEHYPPKLEDLAGVDLEDLNVDATATATVSANLINEILDEVKTLAARSLNNVEYEIMFGDNVEALEDDSFVGNEIVTKKEEVKDSEGNVVGYVYYGTLSSTKIPGKETADLTIKVGVNLDGKVTGLYTHLREHTPRFYDRYEPLFAITHGMNLYDLQVDGIAEATISHQVITNIIEAIKGVAK